MARSGYTLPVFAVAAAKAALLHLQAHSPTCITLELLPGTAEISLQQVALLDPKSALAIALSDPGDNLDLTRDTPIWAWVKLTERQPQALMLEGGEGLGKTAEGSPAIYSYARRLFDANLLPLIPGDRTVVVSIIFPEGRQLAERTSNEAFGVLEGLSLLGTSGISQPLSAADHLETFREVLQEKAKTHPNLVFCIGSSGMQVAERLGIPANVVVQTGNWIGALLVEAGLRGVQSVLLLGYQGKLIKLAGGIFNTSSHLADAKLEIISAAVLQTCGDLKAAQIVLGSKTADAAYKSLVELKLVPLVFGDLTQKISARAASYVQKYANVPLKVGTMLTDRQGQVVFGDAIATALLALHLGS